MDAVAQLFDRIADCLASITTDLRRNREPDSGCQELGEYLNHLSGVLGKTMV
jgi:hypothetical protein